MYEVIGRAPDVIDIERAFARKALQNPTDEFAGRFRACAKINLTHFGQCLGGANARSQETDVGVVQGEVDHAKGEFFQLGARLQRRDQGPEDFVRKPTAFGFNLSLIHI